MITVSAILCVVYLWYFVWNPYISNIYGLWYNSGETLRNGYIAIVGNMGKTLENFYFNSFYSYAALLSFCWGLYRMFKAKNRGLTFIFTSMFVVFLIYMLKSGYHFHQNYYIIPFVPIMALVAGYGMAQINKKWLVLLLLIASIGEGIANQQHDFFIKKSMKPLLNLEPIADRISKRTDLIAMGENSENPQRIYLAHRKGWLSKNSQLADTSYVNGLREKNCKFIFICKNDTDMVLPYQRVYSDAGFYGLGVLNIKL